MNGTITGRVLRGMLRAYRLVLAWYWGIMLVVFGGITFAIAYFDDITKSMWTIGANGAPKWFLMVVGIILASTAAPVYIAHGVTRRTLGTAVLLFSTILSTAFALVVLVGYAVERLVFSATELHLTDAHPLDTLGPWWLVTAAGFNYLGSMLAGVLIGASYYRFGGWGGTAMLPLALPGLFVTEMAFDSTVGNTWMRDGLGLGGDISLLAASGIGLVMVALTAVIGAAILRSMPIRPRKG